MTLWAQYTGTGNNCYIKNQEPALIFWVWCTGQKRESKLKTNLTDSIIYQFNKKTFQ